MKKALCLLLPLVLHGDSSDDLDSILMDQFEPQVQESQMQPTPTRPVYQSENNRLIKTTQAQDKIRWQFDGEALYMKPYLSNVPYLIINDLSNLVGTPPYGSVYSKIQSQTFDSDLGFRIHGSFQTNWIDSLITASWVHFNTETNQQSYSISNFGDSKGFGAPVGINYVWNSIITEPYLNTSGGHLTDNFMSWTANATGRASLNLDFIDGMLKFPFMARKQLYLTPSIGVKGVLFSYLAHIDRLKNYNNTSPVTTPPFNENSVYLKQHFNAVGPSMSLDGSAELGHKWYLDATLQGSYVFGQLNTYNYMNLFDPSPDLKYVLYAKTNTFKPVVNFRIGFSWDKIWDDIGLVINFGYDLYWMPNMLQLVNPVPATDSIWRSDLSVQGVYGGLGLKF